MRYMRIMMTLGAAAMSAAIACSDSNTTQPDAARTALGTSGNTAGSDTAKSNPATGGTAKPDSGKTTTGTGTTKPDSSTTKPDTAGQTKPSSDPRVIVGVVNGLGAVPDTSNYQRVAGATVVLSTAKDSTSGAAAPTQLASVISAADGSFSFGSFKPGLYTISVTPPAGSGYVAKSFPILINTLAPATVSETVWLNRP